MWSIGSQCVFEHDELTIRELLPDAVQQPLAGVAFTIILGAAITTCDGLEVQWQRSLEVGMHDGGRQKLMIEIVAALALSHAAMLATDST